VELGGHVVDVGLRRTSWCEIDRCTAAGGGINCGNRCCWSDDSTAAELLAVGRCCWSDDSTAAELLFVLVADRCCWSLITRRRLCCWRLAGAAGVVTRRRLSCWFRSTSAGVAVAMVGLLVGVGVATDRCCWSDDSTAAGLSVGLRLTGAARAVVGGDDDGLVVASVRWRLLLPFAALCLLFVDALLPRTGFRSSIGRYRRLVPVVSALGLGLGG
jgi:hypothetical protein